MRDDGRYRINDEAARLPVPGTQLLIFLSLPLTVYLCLRYAVLFAFIPGAIGLLIGGRHRWFDPLMGVLTFLLNIFGNFVIVTTVELGLEHVLLLFYLTDLIIAIVFLPLFYSVWQQQRTVQLREAMAL
ncbi:hypothetical protein [Alteraurantiacibacter aquimixticola]|uniref:Uncharacterized protein n=1 Tax=Alteraurantiacibacter aquimixticola TaxID=2489173 RepID=A0A4T3EY63_9SPHN|nr:hypothetical protein [Alteraurantiacibacter aquimixticola]TIX49461.1 hypothetical protein E5222_11450 [Alteraurantiacibacter aquimixticola]